MRSSTRPRICGASGPGDILVFLPGEREIRETGDLAAREPRAAAVCARVEILPLYARLSVQEQQRIFAPSRGRRIVLATNVAETSLTVPGHPLRDRYRARARQALHAAQQDDAAADREDLAGGRAAARGPLRPRRRTASACACTREDDFAAPAEYTDPEILRSSLASVILRMAALDLGDVEAFPFLEPPTPRAIADGYQLLQELGAVDDARALTPLGRELARLPLDPRIGRIVLAARDSGCLAEVLVIASALSVPDPRERPLDEAAGGRPGAPALPRRALRFPVAGRALGILRPSSRRRSSRIASSSTPAARSSCLPAAHRMARRASPARERARGGGLEMGRRRCRRRSTTRATRRCTRRCSPGCSATSASKARTATAIPARAASASTCIPGSGLAKKRAEMGAGRRARRDDAAVRALRGAASSPSGSRRSRATA